MDPGDSIDAYVDGTGEAADFPAARALGVDHASGLTWLVVAALSPLGGRVRLSTRSMICRGREARLGYRLPASAVLSTKANLTPALLSWAGTISAAISRYSFER